MKQLIIALAFLISCNLSAQDSNTNNENKKSISLIDKVKDLANTETKKLTKELKLSEEQQNEVYTIFSAHFSEKLKTEQKVKQVKDSNSKQPKSNMNKRLIEHNSNATDKLNAQLNALLNAKQQKQFIKLLSKQN